MEQLHGDFACAAITAGFVVKYCNEYTRIALIRARFGPHRFVQSSIPFITSIDNQQGYINILYVGATIKQAAKFIKEYQRKRIESDLVLFKDTPEYEKLCAEYMNIQPAMTMK